MSSVSSRCRNSFWSAAVAVATKIVSSPARVPTTSGKPAWSSASATVCAEPTTVSTTVRFGPAGRAVRTKWAASASSCGGDCRSGGVT